MMSIAGKQYEITAERARPRRKKQTLEDALADLINVVDSSSKYFQCPYVHVNVV
jgi:hypothetical protein